MKAGIIEIADIFIINKSDRPGSKRISRLLSDTLHTFVSENNIVPAVMNATASIGDGISEIFEKILLEIDLIDNNGTLEARRLARYKSRIKDLISEKIEKNFWTENREKLFMNITKSISSIDTPPSTIVEKILSEFE